MTPLRKYFEKEKTLSDAINSAWGVSVLTVGHHEHPANTPYPDHKHPSDYYFTWENGRILDEFQMLYISHGSGIFESDTVRPTPVSAGTAFLLFPGHWHRYRPSEETGWVEYWVGFKGSYADFLMSQACFKPDAPLLNIGFNSEFLHVFTHLIEVVKNEELPVPQLTSCLTIQLLALVYASAIMADTDRNHQIIQQARYRIQEHDTCDLDMQELARELNVGYAWFRKEFKQQVGVSPGQYHLGLRINRARQLLRESTLTVSQIARQTGFESEFYFSRLFKSKTGFSPLQYRKHERQTLDAMRNHSRIMLA